MHYQEQNGKLVIVADVVRLLPRHWDGQRLLRFVAGLALVALAFAAHAGLITSAPAPDPGAAAPVSVVAASSGATSSAAASSGAASSGAASSRATSSGASSAVADSPAGWAEVVAAPPIVPVADPVVVLGDVDVPAGVVPAAAGARAPPRV